MVWDFIAKLPNSAVQLELRLETNLYLNAVSWEVLDWVHLAQDSVE
jgi:hypothetical protein